MFQVIEVNGQKYQEVPTTGKRPEACKGCCFHYGENGCSAPAECQCGGPDYPEQNGKWLKY